MDFLSFLCRIYSEKTYRLLYNIGMNKAMLWEMNSSSRYPNQNKGSLAWEGGGKTTTKLFLLSSLNPL